MSVGDRWRPQFSARSGTDVARMRVYATRQLVALEKYLSRHRSLYEVE